MGFVFIHVLEREVRIVNHDGCQLEII